MLERFWACFGLALERFWAVLGCSEWMICQTDAKRVTWCG